MQKIVVIGSPGAGKSTFARRLGEVLAIDVYHLDRFFWDSGWHEKPRNNRIKIQRSLIEKERWIIEGTYLSTSDERLNAADTIIFLDMPLLLCLWRVIKRRIVYRDKSRPDLPQGCREKLRFPYMLKVLVFSYRERRLFLQKIKQIEDNRLDREQYTTFYRLKSNQDIEAFLQEQAILHSTLSILMASQRKSAISPKALSTAAFILGCLWIGLNIVTSLIPLASL